VKNVRGELCGFVLHSPADFWKEFTRNYPGIKKVLVEDKGISPFGQLEGCFTVLQVSRTVYRYPI
jgi:hypothetical protein